MDNTINNKYLEIIGLYVEQDNPDLINKILKQMEAKSRRNLIFRIKYYRILKILKEIRF